MPTQTDDVSEKLTAAFNAMLDKAVADMHKLQRACMNEVHVWAFATTAERDGFLFVGHEHPEGQGFGVWIAPNANGASGHRTWSSVPYSATRSILRTAVGREPILPIIRDAEGRA